MPWLESNGFVTVINLRGPSEEGVNVEGNRAAAEVAGIDYVHLPFDTKKAEPYVVPDFLATVSDKNNQPVYICCSSATRAASLWMISRVLRDGWTIEVASDEARQIARKPDESITYAIQYLSSHHK